MEIEHLFLGKDDQQKAVIQTPVENVYGMTEITWLEKGKVTWSGMVFHGDEDHEAQMTAIKADYNQVW